MRRALVLSVLFVLVPAALAQNWFSGTLDQAVARAKSENKLVLVNFYSGG